MKSTRLYDPLKPIKWNQECFLVNREFEPMLQMLIDFLSAWIEHLGLSCAKVPLLDMDAVK